MAKGSHPNWMARVGEFQKCSCSDCVEHENSECTYDDEDDDEPTEYDDSKFDDSTANSLWWNPFDLVPIRELIVWRNQPQRAKRVKVRFIIQNYCYEGQRFAWKVYDDNRYRVTPPYGILHPSCPQLVTITCPAPMAYRMQKDWLEIVFQPIDCATINWRTFWLREYDSCKTDSVILDIRFLSGRNGQRFFETMPYNNTLRTRKPPPPQITTIKQKNVPCGTKQPVKQLHLNHNPKSMNHNRISRGRPNERATNLHSPLKHSRPLYLNTATDKQCMPARKTPSSNSSSFYHPPVKAAETTCSGNLPKTKAMKQQPLNYSSSYITQQQQLQQLHHSVKLPAKVNHHTKRIMVKKQTSTAKTSYSSSDSYPPVKPATKSACTDERATKKQSKLKLKFDSSDSSSNEYVPVKITTGKSTKATPINTRMTWKHRNPKQLNRRHCIESQDPLCNLSIQANASSTTNVTSKQSRLRKDKSSTSSSSSTVKLTKKSSTKKHPDKKEPKKQSKRRKTKSSSSSSTVKPSKKKSNKAANKQSKPRKNKSSSSSSSSTAKHTKPTPTNTKMTIRSVQTYQHTKPKHLKKRQPMDHASQLSVQANASSTTNVKNKQSILRKAKSSSSSSSSTVKLTKKSTTKKHSDKKETKKQSKRRKAKSSSSSSTVKPSKNKSNKAANKQSKPRKNKSSSSSSSSSVKRTKKAGKQNKTQKRGLMPSSSFDKIEIDSKQYTNNSMYTIPEPYQDLETKESKNDMESITNIYNRRYRNTSLYPILEDKHQNRRSRLSKDTKDATCKDSTSKSNNSSKSEEDVLVYGVHVVNHQLDDLENWLKLNADNQLIESVDGNYVNKEAVTPLELRALNLTNIFPQTVSRKMMLSGELAQSNESSLAMPEQWTKLLQLQETSSEKSRSRKRWRNSNPIKFVEDLHVTLYEEEEEEETPTSNRSQSRSKDRRRDKNPTIIIEDIQTSIGEEDEETPTSNRRHSQSEIREGDPDQIPSDSDINKTLENKSISQRSFSAPASCIHDQTRSKIHSILSKKHQHQSTAVDPSMKVNCSPTVNSKSDTISRTSHPEQQVIYHSPPHSDDYSMYSTTEYDHKDLETEGLLHNISKESISKIYNQRYRNGSCTSEHKESPIIPKPEVQESSKPPIPERKESSQISKPERQESSNTPNQKRLSKVSVRKLRIRSKTAVSAITTDSDTTFVSAVNSKTSRLDKKMKKLKKKVRSKSSTTKL